VSGVEAFFELDGDVAVPTPYTRGPWSADAQHAGPAAALLGRAIEALEPAGEVVVARFTFEVLSPLPVRPLRVSARVVRPGRRVQLAEAALLDADGEQEVARAAAWRLRPPGGPVPERNLEACPFPAPEACREVKGYTPGWEPNYFQGMRWRSARGEWPEPGPAAVWMGMAVPLVPGEEPSPLSRVLAPADSANGISWEVPFDRFLFVNLDLTVHLARMPVGEWVCVDAVSRIAEHGIGLSQSVLWDERGRIGAGAQALLVSPR
jgi:Thioesterase-like superfamily